jgi:hypothetical protein
MMPPIRLASFSLPRTSFFPSSTMPQGPRSSQCTRTASSCSNTRFLPQKPRGRRKLQHIESTSQKLIWDGLPAKLGEKSKHRGQGSEGHCNCMVLRGLGFFAVFRWLFLSQQYFVPSIRTIASPLGGFRGTALAASREHAAAGLAPVTARPRTYLYSIVVAHRRRHIGSS